MISERCRFFYCFAMNLLKVCLLNFTHNYCINLTHMSNYLNCDPSHHLHPPNLYEVLAPLTFSHNFTKIEILKVNLIKLTCIKHKIVNQIARYYLSKIKFMLTKWLYYWSIMKASLNSVFKSLCRVSFNEI